MRFDLHTHTNRYSGCARATPQEMMEGAIRQGLDGVVITEHDTIWSEGEIKSSRLLTLSLLFCVVLRFTPPAVKTL